MVSLVVNGRVPTIDEETITQALDARGKIQGDMRLLHEYAWGRAFRFRQVTPSRMYSQPILRSHARMSARDVKFTEIVDIVLLLGLRTI